MAGLLCTLAAQGQSRGMLSGIVSDAESLSPIEGATVLSVGTLWGAITDAEGMFTLGPLNAGEHTILVTAADYRELARVVRIEADSTLVVELALMIARPELPSFSPLVQVPVTQRSPGTTFAQELLHLPGVTPVRASGLETLTNLRGLPRHASALYLDGIRILEAPGAMHSATTMLAASAVDQVLMAGGPYGLLWGPGTLGGWSVARKKTVAPGVETTYDSRLRGLRTDAVYSGNIRAGYGEVSGIYARTGDYADGSGSLQDGRDASAGLQARGRAALGERHELEGLGRFEIRNTGRMDGLTKNMQAIVYRFKRESGLLEGAAIQMSRQKWAGHAHASQQSGRLLVRLRPGHYWSVHTGLDFIRLPTMGQREESAFVRTTRVGGRVSGMITARTDRLITHGHSETRLHFQASGNWGLSRSVRLVAGLGRWASFDSQGIERVFQIDAGMGVDKAGLRAVVRAWRRWQGPLLVHGTDIFVETPVLQDQIEVSIIATGIDQADLPVFHGRLTAIWVAPVSILRLGTVLSTASGTRSAGAWITSDVWLHVAGLLTAEFTIAAKNLFDRTYAWGGPDRAVALAEPGRSLVLTVRYRL